MVRQEAGIWAADEAEAWDRWVPRSQTVREAEFLTWAFKKCARREVVEVLDLGCGAGRLAISLASRGYKVTGIDNSAMMLRKTRENARKAGVGLHVERTALEELAVAGGFDAAYGVYGVFNYLLEERALSRALASLQALLRPGGLLVIDATNYSSLYGRWKKVLKAIRRGPGWEVRRVVTPEVDDVNMLLYHNEANRMEIDGKVRAWKETHVLRMWTFPELRNQLLASGFHGIHLFGQMRAGTRESKVSASRLVIAATRD